MPYRYLPYLDFVLLPLLTGCAQKRIDSTWVQAGFAGSDTGVPYPAMNLSGDAFASSKLEEPTGKLTLQRALSLALKHNPDLLALSWEVRARRARARQAGLLPNPEAELGVDEFSGSGKRKDFDAAEVSFQLSQRLELGGNRIKRARSAALEEELSV